MENQGRNMGQPNMVVVSQKSNAPMVTGLIGFLLGLPAALCATLCAGFGAAANDANGGGAEFFVLLPVLFIIAWILGFILCFSGKSDSSKATGLITLFCGLFMFGAGIPQLNIMGIVASIFYIISGACAISNASKA